MNTHAAVNTIRNASLEQDVFDVKQAMIEYVWSLDFSDWERLRRVFADDIVFRSSNMGHYEGADNLVREFQNRTVRTPIRRHMLASAFVDVQGDNAVFTSYNINTRVRPGAPGGDYFFGAGYYRNSFRRTTDGWKMYAFQWEATLLEGNSVLVPTSGPTIYLPVMSGLRDAPWGGLGKSVASRQDRSDYSQIEDLIVGLHRAADADDIHHVTSSFREDATIAVAATSMSRQAGAGYLCASQRDSWQTTFLTNVNISIDGGTGHFGAYAYVNRPTGDPDGAFHGGGIVLAKVTKGEDGWGVATYQYVPLWDRRQPVVERTMLDADILERARLAYAKAGLPNSGRAERDVASLMSRYTWCYDLADFDQIEEVFHPDTDSSFNMNGTQWNIGRAQMLANMKASRQSVNQVMHYVYNVDVKLGLDGESAFVRCYANTRRTHDDSERVAMAGGHYVMHARKCDGRWKFDSFRYTRTHEPFL